MVVLEDEKASDGAQSVGSPLARLALLREHAADNARRTAESKAVRVLDRMVELGEMEGALDLRTGEYIHWLRAHDLRKADYASFTAFATEVLDMDRSWAVRLSALAASDLPHVKAALCRNEIPISTAVLAPNQIERWNEVEWIERAKRGKVRLRRPRRPRVDVGDAADARLVDEERRHARTVIGRPCSDAFVDAHIIDAWANRRDGRAMVRQAVAPRERLVIAVPKWDEDPAAERIGPRVVPRDENHCVELLEDVLRRRRMRTLELGFLFGRTVGEKLYAELAYRSAEDMVRAELPISVRSLQDYARQWDHATYYPELEAALHSGMDLARILAIFEVATEDNVARWLAVARRTGLTEIRRATMWALEVGGGAVLERYEHAIAETQDAHTWVALKAARRVPKPPTRIEAVDPDLVDACKWYRDHVPLPRYTGFASVKNRERFECENPLCNTVTLRTEGHHKKRRIHGGTNAHSNASCLCRPCHLRGVHGGGFTLAADAKGHDVWTYPSGRRVMVF